MKDRKDEFAARHREGTWERAAAMEAQVAIRKYFAVLSSNLVRRKKMGFEGVAEMRRMEDGLISVT